jgi:hypothetical protein
MKSTNIELKKKYAILALKWCKKYFGTNQRKRSKLTLNISNYPFKRQGFNYFGSYCFNRNRINIFEPNCDTLYDIVSTIIHEYTHYLQSRTKYKMFEKTHDYSKNPLEKEAQRNEKKYTKLCIKEIRKLIR